MRKTLTRAALAACLLLCACHRREAPANEGVSTGTLLLGNGAEPQDLDPAVCVDYPDYNILVALFEGLTCIDERTSLAAPGAAERWDVSADGLTYTFHLRPGLKWSNGDFLGADDFVYSFRRTLSPALASEYAYILFPIRNAEAFHAGKLTDPGQLGVRAANPRTVVIELEHPCPYLPVLAAHQAWMPVHRPSVERFGGGARRGADWTRPGNLIGNGPFVLREWVPNARIVVASNPLYWDAANNHLKRVVFFPTEDLAADERAFRAGQVHVTFDLLPDRIARYRQQQPQVLRIDPFSETRFLRFNATKPPLDDPRVRLALAKAIDRDAIARDVLSSSRAPAAALTPPNTGSYSPRAGIKMDFDEARRLLASAGFPGGKGFPAIEIQVYNDATNVQVLEAIQQMWRRELGVDASIKQLDFRVYLDNRRRLFYQVSFSRWIADYNDPSTYLDMFRGDCGNNQTGWANPEFDRLTATADRTLDAAVRDRLLQDAETLLLHQAPIAPLFYGSHTYLIRPEVKGWVPAPLGTRRYQYIQLVK